MGPDTLARSQLAGCLGSGGGQYAVAVLAAAARAQPRSCRSVQAPESTRRSNAGNVGVPLQA